MERFPPDILHNIFYRAPIDSVNQCTMVCRAWRVAARHVLHHTAGKMIIGAERLSHYAHQLDAVPGYGQSFSTVSLFVRAAASRVPGAEDHFENLLRRWPLLSSLSFQGANPGHFVDCMLERNPLLPHLEHIGIKKSHISALGHSYLDLLSLYRLSLYRVYVEISAANLIDPLLFRYGNVAQYCTGFLNLRDLVLVTDRRVALHTLLLSCPVLQSLELVVSPDVFRVVQEHADIIQTFKLQVLKSDIALLSPMLCLYLVDNCPAFFELSLFSEIQSSITGVLDTFDTVHHISSLPIKRITFERGFAVSPQMLTGFTSWFDLKKASYSRLVLTARFCIPCQCY